MNGPLGNWSTLEPSAKSTMFEGRDAGHRARFAIYNSGLPWDHKDRLFVANLYNDSLKNDNFSLFCISYLTGGILILNLQRNWANL